MELDVLYAESVLKGEFTMKIAPSLEMLAHAPSSDGAPYLPALIASDAMVHGGIYRGQANERIAELAALAE